MSAKPFKNWLSARFADLGVKVSGKDDAATHAAIRDAQAAAGLRQTGTATAEFITWLRDATNSGRSLSSFSPNRQMTGMGARPLPPVDLQGAMTGGSGMGASINLGQMQSTLKPNAGFTNEMFAPVQPPQIDTSLAPPPLPPPPASGALGWGDMNSGVPADVPLEERQARRQQEADIASGRMIDNSPEAQIRRHNAPIQFQRNAPGAFAAAQQLPSSISQGQFDQRFGAALQPAEARTLAPDILQQLMGLIDGIRGRLGVPDAPGWR